VLLTCVQSDRINHFDSHLERTFATNDYARQKTSIAPGVSALNSRRSLQKCDRRPLCHEHLGSSHACVSVIHLSPTELHSPVSVGGIYKTYTGPPLTLLNTITRHPLAKTIKLLPQIYRRCNTAAMSVPRRALIAICSCRAVRRWRTHHRRLHRRGSPPLQCLQSRGL
jgi:hypothetical protein